MAMIRSSLLQSCLKLSASNVVTKIVSLHSHNFTKISYSVNNCFDINDYVINRNPRNLERLNIARKPTGFHLEKHSKAFWHKVVIECKSRYVMGKVYHNNGKAVIRVSTNEWGISKYLYRNNGISSYICLAEVLASRCLESGINYMINGIEGNSFKKQEFIKHFEECGITLQEPSVYSPLTPWNLKVDVKPWKIHID